MCYSLGGFPGEGGYPGNCKEIETYPSNSFFVLFRESIMDFQNYVIVFEISVSERSVMGAVCLVLRIQSEV